MRLIAEAAFIGYLRNCKGSGCQPFAGVFNAYSRKNLKELYND